MRRNKLIYNFLAHCFDTLRRIYYHIITNNQKNMMPQCGKDVCFGRTMVENITGLKPSAASNLIKLLKDNGLKLAVASSSAYDYLEYNLKKSKIFDYFDLIYSGRDLEVSKPNPLIYQKTAQDLGLDVSECAVIEDSYYGIQAGKRAKMFVIGIKDFNFDIDQSEADILVNDCYEASLFLLGLSASNKTNNSKADNKNR